MDDIRIHVASALEAWAEEAGCQAVSVKRYSGSWHATAVVDGETVSAQSDTFAGALLLLVAAVDDVR